MGLEKEQTPSNETILHEALNAEGDEKVIKLNQLNIFGSNALIIAVCSKHESDVYSILEAIKGLEMKERKEILTHTNSVQKANALMYAMRSLPDVVPAMLEVIDTLNIKDKTKILKEVSSNQNANALWVAVGRNLPYALQALLKSIRTLEREDQTVILNQRALGGQTLFAHALKHSFDAVVPLFNAHLSVNNKTILNKLPLISKTFVEKRPDLIPDLLKAVGQLSYLEQKKLYGDLLPTQFAQNHFNTLANDREVRKVLREALSHAEVRFHLAKLKHKAEELDKKIGFNQHHCYLAPANEAKTLHQTLESSYKAFMRGEPLLSEGGNKKSPSESSRLLDVWADAIEKATPVLSQHRGIKESLFRLCTLLVTPILWACNKAQGHSFKFFPYSPETDTMHKVNEVMRALQNEVHFDHLHIEDSAPPPYDSHTRYSAT